MIGPVDPPLRPRVLQVVTHLALGGAERVALNLVLGLHERFDFAVLAVAGVDSGELGQSMKSELEEIRVPLFVGTRVPIKFGGMFLAGLRAAEAVRRFRPDIIHLHSEIPESSYAAMVASGGRQERAQLVRTIHGTVYWHSWRKVGRWCDRRMRRSFVAGVSEGAVDAFERLRAESGAGPLPQPPVVIYNGVPTGHSLGPRHRDPGQRLALLFAGRLENEKGADLLPEILRKVRPADGRSCQLSIFGSGTFEAELRALASRPPPGWMITVSAPVPDLGARMMEYDLVVMPSRHEGLGLIAIEAALQGLPVVATDGPGLREAFPAGYPWLAKPDDVDSFARLLQTVIDDPATWGPVAAMAQTFAREHFDAPAMFDAYATLYLQALRAHSSPRDEGATTGPGGSPPA